MANIQLASPHIFLFSSLLSLLSLHFLLSFSLFEFTNSLFLTQSALYALFHYFTSPSKAPPAFLTSRRVLLASSLLSISLLLSYEAYDFGRFHRWQSILLSIPLILDSKSRVLVSSAAISSFLSFHLISTEDNPINSPLFTPWLPSDLRSIIACCSLIYATVLLSREKMEPEVLTHSIFSVLLITTATREIIWPEMRQTSIYYVVLSLPSFVILLIVSFMAIPISIRSYGHQLISTDRPPSHVFIAFFISRKFLLLVSRMYLILFDEASFLSSIPSIILSVFSLICSIRLWISRCEKYDELLI